MNEDESSSRVLVLTPEHQQQLLRLLPAAARRWLRQQQAVDSNDSSNDEGRARKARKRTYSTLKEVLDGMRSKAAELTGQLASLKRQREHHGRDAANHRAADLALTLNTNEYMRSLIETNQQMLNEEPSANSLASFIHLTSDAKHRHNTLVTLKESRLAKAEQYLRARNRQRRLLKPYKANSQCETEQGDFCCFHAEIQQLKGAKSARQAYDALMFTMDHMEISVSEQLGEIPVREDYDALKDGVANYRMRTWGHPTTPQEANCVMFTHFYENQAYNESSDEEGYGITVIDFVDQDDLYPYRSEDNVRRDITIACTISTQRDLKDDQELVVVIQRAEFVKIHSTPLVTDTSVLDELRKGVARWCKVCTGSMRDHVAVSQNSSMSVTSLESESDY